MEGKGLGRGLESIAHLAEDGPDLSGYVSTEVDELLSSKDSPRIAVIWMIIGSISFATMNAMVKFSSGLEGVNVWIVIMVRSSVIAFAVAAFAASRGISLKVNNPKTMLLRCSVGLFAMILYFSALARIPIGQAVTLQYTAPLFVALLSGRLIAEKVQPAVLALVITAFVGIVMIVSPNLSTVEPDALLALGSGFFASIAYILVRELRKTDSAASVIFWFAALSVVGTVVQAAPDLFTLDMRTVAALVGVGICAGGGQVGITMAYHRANAAWISVFSYLTVIVTTFYGFTIFNETLGIADWVGGVLIVGSGIVLVFVVPSTETLD